MRSKILAIAISSGAGVIAAFAVSLGIALVAMVASPIVNLTGPWSTWIAMFVGGGLAAFLLPSAWYLAAPLVGLGATGIVQWLVWTFPAPTLENELGVAPASFDGTLWLQSILISAVGGYICLKLTQRRSKTA